MPKPGVIIASFRERLRGAIKGHKHVPVWLIDGWFLLHVYDLIHVEALSPTDPESVTLAERIAESQDGRAALELIEEFLGMPVGESFALEH